MSSEQPNPMLTLVHTDCVNCGSNSEAVQRDRELLPSPNAVCCEVADLIRLDPREPFGEHDLQELLEPEVECWYCGSPTDSPFRIGKRVFCCKACWSDYAE
jgi:hypothetical protein